MPTKTDIFYVLRVEQVVHQPGRLSQLVSCQQVISPMYLDSYIADPLAYLAERMDAKLEADGYPLQRDREWTMKEWEWNYV